MLLPVAITALLIGSIFQWPVLGSGHFDEGAFCRHDPSVEVFAASFFSAMVVEHGSDVVAAVQATGTVAADSVYDIVLDVLQGEGTCNAEWVAYTSSQPLRFEDTVHLGGYLETSGHAVGQFLLQRGLLDCSSSISLSLDFFALVRAAFKGLDQQKLASYQRAVVRAQLDFLHEHDLNVEDAARDLAYSFYKEVQSSHRGNCTKPKSNSTVP